ncbi:MAG: magnesium transporter [Rhodothermaeota bacterium MED-G18]|nr:MAG: magnesium transporter [Rhodothermaeota bacterium MED-G18]|tara:strand:- start:3257 stop:4645 length:1389 start_codon:yes stop_codon:yes gene_type:complete
MKFELTNNFKEKLKVQIENQNIEFIRKSFHEVSYADIAELLYEFNSNESKYVLDNIDLETSSKIISELDDDTRENFLKIYSSKEIANVLKVIDSDDGTDILLDLSADKREDVLVNIDDKEKSKNLKDLIRYDEEVAGGLMAKELVKCNIDWKINQCIALIRKQAKKVSQIYSVYVTDSKGKLKGKVSLKDIILSNDNSRVKDIYDDFVVSVDAHMNQEDVAQIMQKYDLTVLPVVNKKNKLIGRITIDDVVDVITESAEEERQIMSGITSDVEEDDSIFKLSNARLPWLVIGIFGGLFGAFLLGSFESKYFEGGEVFISLSFFIPLIMATAGNVGIQSSSIVIQTLSSPSSFEISIAQRLIRVILVSILNGIVLSLLVYGGLLLFDNFNFLDFKIYSKTAKIVSVSLFSIVIVSSLLGTITPIILDKLKFNPALASGPFITTSNDLMALAIYFIVALFMGGI